MSTAPSVFSSAIYLPVEFRGRVPGHIAWAESLRGPHAAAAPWGSRFLRSVFLGEDLSNKGLHKTRGRGGSCCAKTKPKACRRFFRCCGAGGISGRTSDRPYLTPILGRDSLAGNSPGAFFEYGPANLTGSGTDRFLQFPRLPCLPTEYRDPKGLIGGSKPGQRAVPVFCGDHGAFWRRWVRTEPAGDCPYAPRCPATGR